MTTTWHYEVGLVVDDSGNPLTNVPGIFRLPTANGPGAIVAASAIVDSSGTPATIRTSSYGLFSRFAYVSPDDSLGGWGYLDFNGVVQPVASFELLNALPTALAARTAALAAQTAAEQALADLKAYAAAGGGGGGGGASLQDGAPVKTSAWSSDKTNSVITDALATLVGAAPSGLNTLEEIAAALGNNPSFGGDVTTALASRLRVDQTQSLSAAQQLQGQANLGVGKGVKASLSTIPSTAAAYDALGVRDGDYFEGPSV